MSETYECEWDGKTQLSVSEDPDGYVELAVGPVADPDDHPRDNRGVLLTPDTARRLARTVTLTTFSLEGEDISDAVPEPCPDSNKPCAVDCPLRRTCHETALDDVPRASLDDGTAPPLHYPAGAEPTAAESFLAARKLAGPAASLDDVLRVADYLKGGRP
ncbi:hypothetical protein [Streptomyces sp. x-80]|uniref:hypothetical protein n=1 Tax=Streptomyces sp. x-80 TaxID=2789282 RepID=UPI0039807E7A